MFGVGPYAGRVITPAGRPQGRRSRAVISYRAWQQKFGGDPSVIGGAFTMNGQPFTIVGIAPPGFFGDRLENPAAFWIPIADEPLIDGASSIVDFPQQDWLDIIGRITPGADPKQIEAHMQVELQQWLLDPIAKLQPGERALVPKQTLHLSPGRRGSANAARRIPVRAAPADVDFRAGAGDRVRQRGQPDAGARHQPQAADLDSSRAGRVTVAADTPGAHGERGAGGARWDRWGGDRVCGDADHSAAGVSRNLRGDSHLAVFAGAGIYVRGGAAHRNSCSGWRRHG
jgi:hypothetical protein